MSDKRTEFLRKLRDLLAEYDVTIVAGYDGDTHGIYDEHITVSHKVAAGSFREEEWLCIPHQTHLAAKDIDEAM